LSDRKPGRRESHETGFRGRSARSGQAFLETFLTLMLLCVLLFGFLQIAIVFSEREILHHAASRAARARAVGFNPWMARKAARVAAIPVSGRFLAEEVGWDPADGDSAAAFERARIPEYLAAENHARAEWILDYEEWQNGALAFQESGGSLSGSTLDYAARHDAPLRMPFARLLVPWAPLDDEGFPRVEMEAEATAGHHAGLYLE